MSGAAPHEPTAEGTSRPAASLATISLSRRRAPPVPKAKAGDLTPQLAPPPPEAEPIFIPPALEPLARALARDPLAPIEPLMEFEPVAELRCAGEFLAYWEKLRHNRAFPSVDEIDRDFVAASWQDSMIVDFAFAPTMPHIARLGRPSGDVAYMPLMTDWLLSRGRHAARRGVPLDELQVFEGEGESLRFRVLLLPLGTANGMSDCVLCHMSRDS